MAKLTVDDLKKIKEKSNKETSLRHGKANIKVTVHMGTCGIAAGARQVMSALVEEISRSDRPDIEVASSGCIGHCKNEPNITIEIGGNEPVIYQKMTPDKMRQVFQKHILGGEVQEDYILRN